ncbi:MAG TPA: PIG-L family deacetylase [Terracidiphilus sp.]|nr:PIG-L family deacetylase [Terracidiphilus sp.]
MFTGAKTSSLSSALPSFATLAALVAAGVTPLCVRAQAPDPSIVSPGEPTSIALGLAEDCGNNALEQSLKKLHTIASVMMIVAHPDDEDGPLLTYLSRGLGARATLYTLTRGEGGQNVMSADTYDALGIIRTNELLKSDQYSGAQQLWGTQADFGFSKTQEESFSKWGHERVLYDAVLAVRRARPQVIVATFVGAVSDGHGQHQVSGEIAQEVFKAAGDPKVFPDQFKDGVTPWQPLAVYGMIPFAPISGGRMFDYATGKSAPAEFRNYITGEVIHGELSTDAIMPTGDRDPLLGLSYTQISREGWGQQKSQNGGANPVLSGPSTADYHLWAVVESVRQRPNQGEASGGLFDNGKVDIDTSLVALARLAGDNPPGWLRDHLRQIAQGLSNFDAGRRGETALQSAHALAAVYRTTMDLRKQVDADSSLSANAKSSILFELDAKLAEFQSALRELLGLDLIAFRTNESGISGGGFRGNSADETPASVSPGEQFKVRIHASGISSEVRLTRAWFESPFGGSWLQGEAVSNGGKPPVSDAIFNLKVPDDAEPTRPYFTRPNIEQPYYDVSNPAWRGRSFAPWPLSAWAEFAFDGVPIRLGEVVQTLQRVTGPGGVYEPLVVTPAIGVSVSPEARILPLDGGPLPVRVMVHTLGAADGTVTLKLPEGWRSDPAEAHFHRTAGGETEPMLFSVTPADHKSGEFSIEAVAQSGGKTYSSGWRSVGYAGLRPYNMYKDAELKTRRVDVKLAPGLRVGYVMGPGDLVPEAIEAMGITPHLLSADELTSGDLSAWNVLVIGIRAYSTRPELSAAEPRLEEFVRNGGTLIVQYQSSNFPAPLPLSLSRFPERVVDEQAPVKVLDASNRLLTFPNTITSADFEGWVEERGHSFMSTWDPGYAALTETGDPGQDPQRGGLLVAHPGKGTYIYVAYALYRQLPELVPGAYRILANLLSEGAPAADSH